MADYRRTLLLGEFFRENNHFPDTDAAHARPILGRQRTHWHVCRFVAWRVGQELQLRAGEHVAVLVYRRSVDAELAIAQGKRVGDLCVACLCAGRQIEYRTAYSAYEDLCGNARRQKAGAHRAGHGRGTVGLDEKGVADERYLGVELQRGRRRRGIRRRNLRAEIAEIHYGKPVLEILHHCRKVVRARCACAPGGSGVTGGRWTNVSPFRDVPSGINVDRSRCGSIEMKCCLG